MRAAMLCSVAVLLLQIAGAQVGIAGEVVQVKISDLAFSPVDITVKVGDTIEWVNNDFVDHTATATKGGNWDIMIVAGQSAQQQMTNTGTIKYFCRFHPDMTGTIYVVND
jgi:plastocyanin